MSQLQILGLALALVPTIVVLVLLYAMVIRVALDAGRWGLLALVALMAMDIGAALLLFG